MVSIVITTATQDEEKTAKKLEAMGYSRQEVWLRFGGGIEEKPAVEQKLFDTGVAQFIVGDYWGRSNGD